MPTFSVTPWRRSWPRRAIPRTASLRGSAAALAVALAAALTCSAARSLESGVEASGFVIRAENLRMRAVELVEQETGRYEAARGALEDRLEDPVTVIIGSAWR